MSSNYPGLWSSNSYESLADDEQPDDGWHRYTPSCSINNHLWADTGMKWTYCMRCDTEGEWNMKDGYTISSRKKSSKVSDKSSDK